MRELAPYLRKIEQKIGKDEQIQIILQETDFQKISDVMNFLRWEWLCVDDAGYASFGIPSLEIIKASAKRSLESAWDLEETGESQVYTSGSGGFTAYKFVFDGLKCLSLKFELTGWEMNYDDVQDENYN